MPLYEYKCRRCGESFEVLQKVTDPPLKKCLKCGGDVGKLLSAPAIQFKGTGWYITDYARGKDGADTKDKTPPAPKKEAGDKKAAPKTES